MTFIKLSVHAYCDRTWARSLNLRHPSEDENTATAPDVVPSEARAEAMQGACRWINAEVPAFTDESVEVAIGVCSF
jgi:hypothetical protein